jgi:N-methylhydantoinase A
MNEQTDDLRLLKVETTPADPAIGVLQGFEKSSVPLENFDYFIHGTTLGINALLTRTGARVAIVTTKGFRDIYELARLDRDEMYDLRYRKPPTLVPRYLRFEVEERVTFEGEVLTPFNQDEAVSVAKRIREAGVESVAVCFLHSYIYPEHELLMAEVLGREYPQVSVTLSHQLSREYREYERTSTTVMDAYVKPITRTYLRGLDTALRTKGFTGHFLLTRSGGGAMTLPTAMQQPAHLILSGPAGGVVGARQFGHLLNRPNLITLDMGGTSLDASLIADGNLNIQAEQKFATLPMMIPTIDIKTIGAGGGSIAWIDEGGLMQVGPQSAGAVPGPVCYGKGGHQATLTDAALLTGYLSAANFLGGDISLRKAPARQAVAALAGPLNMTEVGVATGILQISEAKIVAAVREISIERGYHPKDFALFSFGGGGGLVAAQVSKTLGIPRLIVPPGPGNFSALGMLMVDVVHDYSQTYVQNLAEADLTAITQIYADLLARGQVALTDDGFEPERQLFRQFGDFRYRGQEHSVKIPISTTDFTTGSLDRIVENFNAAHMKNYGHRMDHPIEIVTLRVQAIGSLPRPEPPKIDAGDEHPERAQRGERPVHLYGANQPDIYTIYDRTALQYRDRFEGPAIIEEPTSTTVVHTGDLVTVGEFGELIIEHGN